MKKAPCGRGRRRETVSFFVWQKPPFFRPRPSSAPAETEKIRQAPGGSEGGSKGFEGLRKISKDFKKPKKVSENSAGGDDKRSRFC